MKGFLLLVGVFWCFQGCAPTLDSMVADGTISKAQVAGLQGDYTEVARLVEAEIGGDLAAANYDQLFSLSNAYLALKKYDKLLDCADFMATHLANGDYGKIGSSQGAKPHQLRALAYLDLGQYPQAIREAEKAVQIATHQKNQIGANVVLSGAYGYIGAAHAALGNREQALQIADSLKRLSVYNQYTAFPEIEKQNALAGIYVAIGEYESALAALMAAEPAWQRERDGYLKLKAMERDRSGFYDQIIEAVNLPRQFIMYRCLLELGRIPEAKRSLEAIFPHRADHGAFFLWQLLYDRGRIAAHEGDLLGAREHYQEAIDVIEEQRSSINTEMHKIGFAGDKQAVYGHLIATLIATNQHRLAFEYAERAKARALVDLLAQKQQFAANENDLESASGSIKKMAAMEKALAEDSSYRSQEQKAEIRRSLNVIKNEIRESHPQFASLVTVTPVGAEKLQNHLGADETLIEYFYDDNYLFMFVVTHDQIHARRLEVTDQIAKIKELRRLIAAQEPGCQAIAGNLYDALILPAENLIANSSRLTIVPHGILHYLPYSMLTHSNACLADRFSLRFLPSADVLRYLSSPQDKSFAEILVLGNPDLGDPQLDLPGAEAEVDRIGKMYKGSTVLKRKRATESAVKQYGRRFKVLHFASHGIFNDKEPLSSAILLAPDAENDGRLTVSELYSMNLNADLVTLSACETGLGKLASGDDVVGLTRGFMYAGAQTIVASLWQVSDEATAFLMTSFYNNLKEMPTAKAFRAAQLETKKTFPNPFDWAAFQLIGNADTFISPVPNN